MCKFICNTVVFSHQNYSNNELLQTANQQTTILPNADVAFFHKE